MLGARVERIDLQFHPVDADTLEGVRQREPARFGAQATVAELGAAEQDAEPAGPVGPVEVVQHDLTCPPAVRPVDDGQVQAVGMIGPGGVPAPEFFQAGLALGAGKPERLVIDGGQPGSVGRINGTQQHPLTSDRRFLGKRQLATHNPDHAARRRCHAGHMAEQPLPGGAVTAVTRGFQVTDCCGRAGTKASSAAVQLSQ